MSTQTDHLGAVAFVNCFDEFGHGSHGRPVDGNDDFTDLNARGFANGPSHPGLPARRGTLTKKRFPLRWLSRKRDFMSVSATKNLVFVHNGYR